jgi:hypothetical protein
LQLIESLLSAYKDGASILDILSYLPVHCAIESEHGVDVTETLLNAYPQALSRGANFEKNLLSVACAASSSRIDVIEYLLQRCPELAQMPNSDGKLPLHAASEWGSVNQIERIYAAYPDAIKMFTNTGVLPLHYALANEAVSSSEQKNIARFLLRHHPEAANLRSENIDDNDGENVADDDEYYFDENENMRITPYKLSRFVSDPEMQRILLRSRPEADLQQYRKMNYEARRQLMFLAFAACTNPLPGGGLPYSDNLMGTGTWLREKITARQKAKGAVSTDSGEFVYHLRRLMNIGKEMGLLKHIASFL